MPQCDICNHEAKEKLILKETPFIPAFQSHVDMLFNILEERFMSFLDSMPVKGRHVEWFTPTNVKQDLINEWGIFDLDVATAPSNPMDAIRFFTKEDDALKQEWIGENVYLNPPYGRIISQFIDKAILEWGLGHSKRIVMLLPSRTDTKWFHKLYEHPAVEIRFYKGRLRFNDANPAPMPSMLAIIE